VNLLSTLDKLLNTNEKVIWNGKPVKKAFVLPGLFSIPLGLIFLAFGIFWLSETTSASAPSFFTLFGLIFALIALGITFAPSILQFLRYQNTEYMITDKRIITQTGAIGLDTRFVDLEKIQEVYVQVGVIDRLFGTGTVYAMTAGFSGFTPRGSYGYRGLGVNRPSFAALKEPYEVQKLLQEAIEKLKEPKAEL
jgi:uncharacterized membrane protein YdbT with pleckstrin-like domain